MSKVFKKLYAKSSIGKIKIWEIVADGNTMIIRNGYEDMKMAEQKKIIKGKNIGRSNETTDEQQCELECQSKWQKKVDEQYTTDKDDIKDYTDQEVLLPMLALKYRDRKHDIKFPCYVQPKLNGCLFRTTRIETDKGIKTIEDIVENKLQVKVKSYNTKLGIIEWKPVVNWMKNGVLDYTGWYDIVPQYGKHIKVTSDHKIFTGNKWKKIDQLNPRLDKILMIDYESRLNNLIAGTLLGDSYITIEKRGSGQSYRLGFQHTNKEYFDFKVKLFNLKGKIYDNIITGYGSKGWKFVSHALTDSTFPIKLFYNVGHHNACGTRKLLTYRNLKTLLTLESVALWIGDDGSIRYNNNDKTTPVLSLSTHNFPKEQINEFKIFFERKLFCSPSIIPSLRKDKSLIGYSLNFNTKDTLYILNKLRALQCEGVEYKFYFSNEGYIKPISQKEKFITFKTRHSKNMPRAVKYDIEVKDNHNFFANGVLVHNCRCIFQNDKFMSRKGKEYETLDHLRSELKKLGVDIPDGEIYIHGMSFQELVRRVKKDRGADTDELEYWIYDQINDEIFEDRTKNIHKQFSNAKVSKLKYVQTEIASSEEEIKEWHDKWVQEGYEGIIIRNAAGLYKVKHRSKDLQKEKNFMDEEFEIVGGHEGSGPDAGTVVFEVKNKEGNVFSVRPKGTREMRSKWFKDIKKLIGKDLTVRYQNLSESGIPIFPVGRFVDVTVRDYE